MLRIILVVILAVIVVRILARLRRPSPTREIGNFRRRDLPDYTLTDESGSWQATQEPKTKKTDEP